jgi:hypothetical protein
MVLFLMTGFMSVEMKIQSIPKPNFKAILGPLHLLSTNLRQHGRSGPLAAVILPIFASGVMAYLVWAGGAASAVLLFVSILLCGLLGPVVGGKAAKGATLAPTDTQTEMRASNRLALRLFVGRSCAIAALFLLLAMLVCLAFPGHIGWAAIDGAILALAFLLLIEALRARALQGWFLDTALPYQLLQDRLAQATAAERFRICWTAAGRCHGLRQAAALHPEAPAETNALLRAQYAPAAVFVRPPFRHKTVMEEVRLRILGWRMAGLTAVSGAAVALLLILLLPSDMLARLRVLGDVLGLTVEQPAPLQEQQQAEPKADQPSPPQDAAEGADGSTGQSGEGNNPSEAGAFGTEGQGGEKSGGQGQAGQDEAESNPSSSKGEGVDAGSRASGNADGAGAADASSGDSNNGTADGGAAGEKSATGSDGSPPSGAGAADANPNVAPNNAGNGPGEGISAGVAAPDQPEDAGQASDAPQGGTPGTAAASDPTGGTDQSQPDESAESAAKDVGSAQPNTPNDATAAEGQEKDSANASQPDADGTGQPGEAEQPDGGTTAPAPTSDAPLDAGFGTAEDAGSDQPAAPADGTPPSEDPRTGQDAVASGGGADGTAPSGNTGSGQDAAPSGNGADGMASGDITPGDSTGGDITPLNQPPDPNLPMVLTDEPLDGAGEGQSLSTTDPAKPVDSLTLDLAGRIGATAPEVGGKLELQAGGASQLFAEAGEVPDAVVARLPPQNDAPPPIDAAPLPARQLLPAWISELVN